MPYAFINEERKKRIARNALASYNKYKEEYNRSRRFRRKTYKGLNAALKRYGMTDKDYYMLLAKQDGHCALCPATTGGVRSRRLYVDHCHKTGKIRGLLCNMCNAWLIQTVENYSETQIYLAREYIREDRECVVKRLREESNI